MKNLLKKRIQSIIEMNNITGKNKVIDIGCADVRPYSEYLINYFNEYVGIDINDNLLKIAKEKELNNNKTAFYLGNVEVLDFNDSEFDIVVCNNMLAYTNKKLAIEEMLRILKKEGLLISLFNNTIDYSIYKMFRPINRSFLLEFSHSLIVILNTIFFRTFQIKFFRATYNTEKEIRNLLDNSKYDIDYQIEEMKNNLPYSVLNIIIYKK